MNTNTKNNQSPQKNELADELGSALDNNLASYHAKLDIGEAALGQRWLHYLDRRALIASRTLLLSEIDRQDLDKEDQEKYKPLANRDSLMFEALGQAIENKRDDIIFALVDALKRDSHLRKLVDMDVLPPYIVAQMMGEDYDPKTVMLTKRSDKRAYLEDWLLSSDQNERQQRLELLLRWYTDYFELIQPTETAKDEISRRNEAAVERPGGRGAYDLARTEQRLGKEALERARAQYLKATQRSIEEGWQSHDVLGVIANSNNLEDIRVFYGDNFALVDQGRLGYVERDVKDATMLTHPLDAEADFEHFYFHEINHLTGEAEDVWLDEALTEHRALLLLDRADEDISTPRDVDEVSAGYDDWRGGAYPNCRNILALMLELCDGQVTARDLLLAHTTHDEDAKRGVYIRINQALGTKHLMKDISKEIRKYQLQRQGLENEHDARFQHYAFFEEAAGLVAERLAKVAATKRMLAAPKS